MATICVIVKCLFAQFRNVLGIFRASILGHDNLIKSSPQWKPTVLRSYLSKIISAPWVDHAKTSKKSFWFYFVS